jgi:hypothetical protein
MVLKKDLDFTEDQRRESNIDRMQNTLNLSQL